ncbi:MAG: peptide ABC transporter substrate-binding protein [Desulfatitalea sp.]|nr:peptide ABC transporter substrate-binding protein [Desulfatitalea sp.]
MSIRRVLIFAPTLVTLVLLISFYWVPSYEEQTRGNPDRLHQFITAAGGDASQLNPVLAADSTSGQINGLIFEGLLDYDENLNYRGRVARNWRIYEHAYFRLNEKAATARWGQVDGPTLVDKLTEALRQEGDAWRHVTEIALLPPETTTQTIMLGEPPSQRPVTLRIQSPARIRLTLDRVDQLLFDRLATFLGQEYFSSFDSAQYVTSDSALEPSRHAELARQALPATIHNPIVEFHLRPNVRFHDGHALTAADVQFTYNAIMNPKNISPRIPDYEPVQALEVVDPLTVRVVYKRLYSPALGTWAMGILPAHLLDDAHLGAEAKAKGVKPEELTLRKSDFNRHPVGSGPFVFEEWQSDRYLRLKRFEDYWEGAPNYRQYAMRIIPDPLTQEMEFYAGTVDDYNVLPHQVARLSRDERFQHFSGTALGYSYIGYNIRRPPFDDPRVRRALGMAIDTEKIIKYVLYAQGERITGPFPKQTDYYNHDIKPLPYDPEGALKLLAEAGWHRGPGGFLQKEGRRLSFTLITNNGNPERKAILAVAQDAWKKIGVEVNTDLLEWSVFVEKRVNQLDFDALVLGWSMGFDPDLYQIWHSSQSGPFQLNFVGFKNAEADDLILKIRQEYDHRQQVAYCHRLHEIIAEAQPYTFLYVKRWMALLDKRIVRQIALPDGRVEIKPITPTKTGNYTYYFNQWIKLSHSPEATP